MEKRKNINRVEVESIKVRK